MMSFQNTAKIPSVSLIKPKNQLLAIYIRVVISLMLIRVGNGVGNQSSNPGWDCVHFASC